MLAISLSRAPTRIEQILRISAKHFAVASHQGHPAPRTLLIASEFKDPLPLRWTNSLSTTRVQGQCAISV